MPYRILQIGLGPIGQAVTRVLGQRARAKIVAGIDLNPALVGRDLGEVCQQPTINATISDSLPSVLAQHDIDIAIVTTHSQASVVEQQIQPLLEAGISVITTCEELLYPFDTQPNLAERLDALAKQHGATLLATGVNPGFLMDHLPATVSGLAEKIEHITISRVQDAAQRRIPFQKKIGAGLSSDEFQQRVDDGSLRHVGLTESVQLLAHQLQFQLTRVSETLLPVKHGDRIAGVHQQARGYVNDHEVIELNFIAAMNQPNPEDRIIITGTPHLELAFTPPVNGDTATAAITANAIPAVLAATPGLQTMGTIRPLTFWQ